MNAIKRNVMFRQQLVKMSSAVLNVIANMVLNHWMSQDVQVVSNKFHNNST